MKKTEKNQIIFMLGAHSNERPKKLSIVKVNLMGLFLVVVNRVAKIIV